MTMITDMFSPPKPKVEKIPTRDTAADVLNADDEKKRKVGLGYGAGTMMLSGSGGVAREMTGSRGAGGG